MEIGIRGSYLEHPHTLQHIRSSDEFMHKDLFDATGIRAPYEDPVCSGPARWRRFSALTKRPSASQTSGPLEAVVKQCADEEN